MTEPGLRVWEAVPGPSACVRIRAGEAMKTVFAVSIGAAALIIVAMAIVVWLATPRDWPMTAGTIKARKVVVDGQSFVMVEGQPMNYLGQMQSINIGLDDSSNRFIVSRCLVLRSPFSKIVVNNQWPVVYPLADVKPGKYSVVYRSSEGEQTAGSFEVP